MQLKYLDNSYYNPVTSLDPDRLIVNFSDHFLNTTEKSLLRKALNFMMPPKNISFADFMLPFQLLYSNVNSLEVPNLDKEFIKSRLRDSAFSSYKELAQRVI